MNRSFNPPEDQSLRATLLFGLWLSIAGIACYEVYLWDTVTPEQHECFRLMNAYDRELQRDGK